MRRASGFTATALTPPGVLCVRICPMLSTRSTARLCDKRFARISPLSLRGWAAAIGTLFTGSDSSTSKVIPSAREVRQGHLLGPVLFALAIHPVIQESRRVTEATLIDGLRRIGLETNLDKTEVILRGPLLRISAPPIFWGAA